MRIAMKAARVLGAAAVVVSGLGLAAPESRGGEVYVGGYRSGGHHGGHGQHGHGHHGHGHHGHGHGHGHRPGGYWPGWGWGYRPGYGGVIYNRRGDGIPPILIPR